MWTCPHRRRYHYRLYSGPVCLRAHMLNISPPFPVRFNNVRVYIVPPGHGGVRDRWIIGSRCVALETAPPQFPTSNARVYEMNENDQFSEGEIIYIRSGRFRNSVEVYRPGLDRTGRSRDSLSPVNYRVARNEIENARITSSAILI